MSVLKITRENFDMEVLGAQETVLVDFYANWCGPCKMMSPVIDEIADEMSGKVKVGKIDIDDNQEIAQQYEVMSIPTIIIFKQGKEVKRFVGTQPKENILSAL